MNVGRILAAVIVLGVSACSPGTEPSPAPAASSPGHPAESIGGRVVLRFTFDAEKPPATLKDTSGSGYQGTVRTRNGGKVRWVPGRDGSGGAARFPNRCTEPGCTQPTAVIEVAGTGPVDPGGAPFAFGAAVSLRQLAPGANVLQKGRFSDPTQWKLQVDGGYPSCVFNDGRRRAVVRAPIELLPREWYDLECRKGRGYVSVVVNGTERARSDIALGAISSASPLYIGAKGPGETNNDQFHGLVDDVFVRVQR